MLKTFKHYQSHVHVCSITRNTVRPPDIWNTCLVCISTNKIFVIQKEIHTNEMGERQVSSQTRNTLYLPGDNLTVLQVCLQNTKNVIRYDSVNKWLSLLCFGNFLYINCRIRGKLQFYSTFSKE